MATPWCKLQTAFLQVLPVTILGRDSSVDIATRYRPDSPGIESPWGGWRNFPHPSRPAVGLTQPPIQWVPGLSWGVKRRRRGVDHPTPSCAEVKEIVEVYLCSPSWSSWPVIGWILPLPLPVISTWYFTWRIQKYTRIIIYIYIYIYMYFFILHCVPKFTVPTCRPNFAHVARIT